MRENKMDCKWHVYGGGYCKNEFTNKDDYCLEHAYERCTNCGYDATRTCGSGALKQDGDYCNLPCCKDCGACCKSCGAKDPKPRFTWSDGDEGGIYLYEWDKKMDPDKVIELLNKSVDI
jgi:hypothetical protein